MEPQKTERIMKVLKFGAGLFENEQNLSRVKEVVEASEGRVVIVSPERHVNTLRDIIPGSQVVPPQICLAGHLTGRFGSK